MKRRGAGAGGRGSVHGTIGRVKTGSCMVIDNGTLIIRPIRFKGSKDRKEEGGRKAE